MDTENRKTLQAEDLEAMSGLISEVMPECGICGSPARGHLFKLVARTPITEANAEGWKALLQAVRSGDWATLRQFQEWDGQSNSMDVVGLRCVDGRCSLAVLLCPFGLGEPYALLLQTLAPCDADPFTDGFWGEIK